MSLLQRCDQCVRDFVRDYIVDWIEQVQVPKYIIIRSLRLGVLLRLLQVGAVFIIAALVFSSSSLVYEVVPTVRVMASWVNQLPGAEPETGAAYCTEPERYDYVYAEQWRYENYTCVNASAYSRPYIKDIDQALYIPMSYEETTSRFRRHPAANASGGAAAASPCSRVPDPCPPGEWLESGGQGGLCVCTSTRMYFVTGVETLYMSFDYFYEVIRPAAHILASDHSSTQSSSSRCCDRENPEGDCASDWVCEESQSGDPSRNQLKTVCVVERPSGDEGDEAVIGSFVSPQEIRIPLMAVIEAAGLSLDSQFPGSRPNLKYCGTRGHEANCSWDLRPFAVVRQTGLRIAAKLQLYNRRHSLDSAQRRLRGDHQGPMCILSFQVHPAWAGKPQTAACSTPLRSVLGENLCVAQWQYGIEVTFVSAGSFGYYDPIHFMVTLGAGMVYLAVPILTIAALAQYCLGVTSNIYYAAGKEQVKIKKDLAGKMARMLCSMVAFESLVGSKAIGISRQRLHRLMARVFAHSHLKEHEKQLLVDHVFQYYDLDGTGHIEMPEFVEVCTAQEPVGIEDMAQLYNPERCVWPLERLFAYKSGNNWRYDRPSHRRHAE